MGLRRALESVQGQGLREGLEGGRENGAPGRALPACVALALFGD